MRLTDDGECHLICSALILSGRSNLFVVFTLRIFCIVLGKFLRSFGIIRHFLGSVVFRFSIL